MDHHVILTNGRSGSNYMASLINAHPQSVNYGEVLGKWTKPYHLKKFLYRSDCTEEFIDRMLSSRRLFTVGQVYSALAHIRKGIRPNVKSWNKTLSIGIKEFGSEFRKNHLENYLAVRDDIKVIYLFRANQLERFISLRMMQKTGIVSTQALAYRLRRKIHSSLYLNPDQIISNLNKLEDEERFTRSLIVRMNPNRVLTIEYETLFANPESNLHSQQRIQQFLGLKRINLIPHHKKVLPREMSSVVSNYQDVYHAIKGTPHERYLNVMA